MSSRASGSATSRCSTACRARTTPNAHGETTLLVVAQGRFPGAAVAARRAVRRAAAAELPPAAADVRPDRGPRTRGRWRRGWPSRCCCWRAATASTQGEEIRIGLALAQEDLAQLLGASRQRVNQELKGFERDGAVRIEPTRLVVLSSEKLMAIADQLNDDRRTDRRRHDVTPAPKARRPTSHADSTSVALQRLLSSAHLPGFAGPLRGRAVQGRAVEPDLQARRRRRAPT